MAKKKVTTKKKEETIKVEPIVMDKPIMYRIKPHLARGYVGKEKEWHTCTDADKEKLNRNSPHRFEFKQNLPPPLTPNMSVEE